MILCLETATEVCSVAICKGNDCLVESVSTEKRSHSEKLPQLITDSLKKAGLTFEEITAVAVSKGPGSYTGLRIGISMAKGIAYSLKKPLISVNTLKSMVLQGIEIANHDELICPMIDARRSEVYCLVSDQDTKIIWDTQALIVKDDTFELLAKNRGILFLGNGSEKFSEMWKTAKNIRQVSGIFPHAKFIGRIAADKFMSKEFENVATFEPYYLKDFQAGISKKIVPLI